MRTASLSLILLSLSSLADDSPKPKYGPAGKPKATPLAHSYEYFQVSGRPTDFWSLIGYYVPQVNGYSCSAASVAMVLNAARAKMPKTSEDKVVIQPELIEKVNVEGWKKRLSDEGYGDEKIHGTSLDVLGRITEAAFKAYGFPKTRVTVVHVNDRSPETAAKLRKALTENEKSGRDYILANFNQKVFTDDAEAGHIAPVGAYDASKRRVLILDPDREWYEPYWISENTLLEGMNTQDSEKKSYRGYLIVSFK